MRSEIWKYVSAIMAPKILAIYQLFDRIDQKLQELENAKQELDTKFQTLKTEVNNQFQTLQQNVNQTITNFQSTVNNTITALETALFSAINRNTIQNGVVTSPTLQPDASDYDFIQRYTIGRTEITLNMPVLPSGSSAVNNIVLFLDTSQASSVVSLGTGLSFVSSGTDGPILLPGQLYRYAIVILSPTEAYVETTLMENAPAPPPNNGNL